MKTKPLSKVSVYLHEDPCFSAYIVEGEFWNGWVCPYFRKEQGEFIALTALRDEWADIAYYDDKEDEFVFRLVGSDEEERIGPIETMEGKLYPIGSFGWCWDVDQEYVLSKLAEAGERR